MTSSLRRGLLVAAVVATSAAAAVPFAAATVHVDPNGPAGQQYALPLDSARGQASGTPDAGVPGATAKAPLFGQGIGPGTSSSGKHAKAVPNRQGEGQAGGSSGTGTRAVDRAAAAASNGGGSMTVWIAALIAAVVMSGAAAGLIARRGLGAEPRG
jgi:hypothetical protein